MDRKRTILLSLCIIFIVSFLGIGSTATDRLLNSQLNLSEVFLSNDELPCCITKKEAVQKGHVQRLRNIEPDEYTVVFQNSDGTNSLYIYDQPIKYKNEKGQMVDKNNTIITSTIYSNSYQNMSNDVLTVFPKQLETSVKLEYKDTLLEFIYFSDKSIKINSNIVNDDSQNQHVLYKNSENDIDLALQPLLNGFKETFILSKNFGLNEFSYIIKTHGLKLVKNEVSAAIINPDTKEIVYSIGAVSVYDSAGNISYGDIRLETIHENMEYKITLVVDNDFLNDKSTVYPVYVDPSYTVNKTNTYDTSVYQGLPTTNGYEYTSPYNPVGYHNSTKLEAKALIGFDLDALASLQISDITYASYDIYDSSGKQNTMYIMYWAIKESWDHTTVNWNIANSLETSYIGMQLVNNNNQKTSLQITDLARQWVNYAQTKDLIDINSTYLGLNPMYGIMLQASTTGVSSKHFRSAQYGGSTTSALYITYNSTPHASIYAPSKYNYMSNYLTSYENCYQFRMNCYGYALRVFYANNLAYSDDRVEYNFGGTKKTIPVYRQQPGEFTQRTYNYEYLRLQTRLSMLPSTAYIDYNGTRYYGTGNYSSFIYSQLKNDLDELGIGYQVSSAQQAVPSNKRKIALVMGISDYHFYMRNDDGTWSHKQGVTPITNKSIDSKVVLTDSNIANYINEGGYTGTVYYLLIDKCVNAANWPHIYGHFSWSMATTMYN